MKEKPPKKEAGADDTLLGDYIARRQLKGGRYETFEEYAERRVVDTGPAPTDSEILFKYYVPGVVICVVALIVNEFTRTDDLWAIRATCGMGIVAFVWRLIIMRGQRKRRRISEAMRPSSTDAPRKTKAT